jgi:AraC-like DNA-binding protein
MEIAMTQWETPAEPHFPHEPVGMDHALLDDRAENGRNHGMHVRGVERVISAMMQCLDQPMNNNDMADVACQSPFHFNRVFHRLTGIPPVQFHYALRLQHAKRLLISTDLRITDICLEVGYSSLGTFTSRFNALVGMSPTSFRRLGRQLASVQLQDFRVQLTALQALAASRSRTITGAIASHDGSGVVFSGLFHRGIPEGLPVACAQSVDMASYAMPVPEDGHWFVFSVAVPWTASGLQLLLLDGFRRGRSGSIRTDDAGSAGDTAVVLRPPSLLDPPILIAVPLMIWRRFNEPAVDTPRGWTFTPARLANATQLQALD